MPDNITPLDLAQRLAKGWPCPTCIDGKVPVGLPEDGYDCCPDCNGAGMERYPQDAWPQMVHSGRTRMQAGRPPLITTWRNGWLNKPPRQPWYAAPHLADAILWLLGTSAWRAKFGTGGYLRLHATGHAHVWKSERVVALYEPTPADLLRAMLEELS